MDPTDRANLIDEAKQLNLVAKAIDHLASELELKRRTLPQNGGSDILDYELRREAKELRSKAFYHRTTAHRREAQAYKTRKDHP